MQNGAPHRVRRGSLDGSATGPRRFAVNVDPTLRALLATEDTDQNMQITIDDTGPKSFSLNNAKSGGLGGCVINGNYSVSSLLQELTLAQDNLCKHVIIDELRLNENPVDRLSRLIKDTYWDNLTRRIDASVIEVALRDPKDWTSDPRPRIYIPPGVPEQYEYYARVARERPETRLDVQWLPEHGLTPEYVQSLNDKPGMLALEMETYIEDPSSGKTNLRGLPFVVPGGRFNELYGWDSYFCALGLLSSQKPHLVKSIIQNFSFEIKHYGKILNANRSYYLCRSQPPFLTDIALKTYDALRHEPDSKDFLRSAILAAIKEYKTVWMAEPRYDPRTGLSRYRGTGLGVPPETEPTHFTSLLIPYADRHGMGLANFVHAYNNGTLKEPELDTYFLHDHAIRESGHDTSYRLENVAADLATIDLNALLYKYETDIASAIRTVFGDSLIVPSEFCAKGEEPDHVESSALWDRRARRRKRSIDHHLWNEQAGMYFDFNTARDQQMTFESVTSLWALWSGVASPHQAAELVSNGLPKFEFIGGLASCSKESRGEISLDRPNRQWDYPYGWAPHQILAWDGLKKYGYHEDAERLAYRWLCMMTKAFVDFGGVVVEKYDVTRLRDPHRANVEYGNQGGDFKGVAREGFGWVNASYVYGLAIVNSHMKRALGVCAPYDLYAKAVADA